MNKAMDGQEQLLGVWLRHIRIVIAFQGQYFTLLLDNCTEMTSNIRINFSCSIFIKGVFSFFALLMLHNRSLRKEDLMVYRFTFNLKGKKTFSEWRRIRD